MTDRDKERGLKGSLTELSLSDIFSPMTTMKLAQHYIEHDILERRLVLEYLKRTTHDKQSEFWIYVANPTLISRESD